MTPEQNPDLNQTKAALEIEKLKIDIAYAKRTFIAQLVNTIAIGAAAIAGLYFFQRPQLDQMETNRLAAEKHQVGSLVLSALDIANANDRAVMLRALGRMYPQYDFIDTINQSNTVLGEGPSEAAKPQPSSTSPAVPTVPTQQEPVQSDDVRDPSCPALRERYMKLEEELSNVKTQSAREEQGVGGTGKLGRGPAYQALVQQQRRIEFELALVRQSRIQRKCIVRM